MPDETSKLDWPSKGDRPFIPQNGNAQRTGGHSIMDRLLHPDWAYLYREGYYRQGILTAENLRDERRPFDGLVLPMLFSFRHYLELSLKATIVAYAQLADEECPEIVTREHGLMPLWNEAKLLLEKPFGGRDPETPRNVERCLNDFHVADASSQTFRYSKNRDGSDAAARLPQIDLDQLIQTMKNLHSFFEGCDMWAEDALSWMAGAEYDSHY